jgi:hypothetical protein
MENKYFNEETISHFQLESNYISKNEILKSVIEFVAIDCETHSIKDEQMLVDTLMKLIYSDSLSLTIKKGNLVKINEKYLDCPKEKDMIYKVLSNPNVNNRVDIRDINSTLAIPPIESVKVEAIYYHSR